MPQLFDSGRPIYLQLTEIIVQSIVSGAFMPGQRLPGVRELAAQYGVNPNTVQRTMMELERLELVYSERTAGRFVTGDQEVIHQIRQQYAVKEVDAFLQKMCQLGLSREEVLEMLASKQEGEKNV